MKTIKEHPILMAGRMAQGCHEGWKGQTRRVVRPQPPKFMGHVNNIKFLRHVDHKWVPSFNFQWCEAEQNPPRKLERWPQDEHGPCAMSCPYGKPGDRLWLREGAWFFCERQLNGVTKTGRQKWRYEPLSRFKQVYYHAKHPKKPTVDIVHPETGNEWGWRFKASQFMPRWACRTVLELTDVRVERLQDISEEDAKAEGVKPIDVAQDNDLPQLSYREGFRLLWDSLAKPGEKWEDNPWVWRLAFRRVEDE